MTTFVNPVEAYRSNFRYAQWAFVLHRLKPNGRTACGIFPAATATYVLDDDEQGPYFCKRCGERVSTIDPISGTDYEHGHCENCDRPSEQLLATNVESGGCTDRLQLCPQCRGLDGYRTFLKAGDPRPRCHVNGAVLLSEQAAQLVVDRVDAERHRPWNRKPMSKYRCLDHWHVGHGKGY